MANPRKFSEKIAQHKQKQAEETAAFERIMREVSDATNKGSKTRKAKQEAEPPEECSSSLRPASAGLGGYRSGSLPNVAHQDQQQADEHVVQVQPEEVTLATQYAGGGGGAHGGASPSRSPTAQRGRASSSVGPMRARPAERKHDTSPYGSSVYLSPPPDSSWRRTNSDSALHQSCGGGDGGALPAPSSLSPHHYAPAHTSHYQHHRRNTDSNSLMTMLGVGQTRPRSSCEMPRVPGINVYESGGTLGAGGPGGGALGGADGQMPGGSLPDLTSMHYPEAYPASPHRTPPEYHRRSPYHQSPTSPGALSPAGGGGLSPVGGGHSPVGAGVSALHAALHSDHQHVAYDTQNHLSVPNTNSYLHHNNQSMSPLEQSWIQAGYQAHCSPPSLHSSHSNINVPSPTSQHRACYEAQSDIQYEMGGHSPGSPAESPQPDFYISQTLLQPFQQISMMDTPVTNYNTSYMNHSSPSPQTNHSHHTYSQTCTSETDRLCERDIRSERDPVAGGNAPLFPPVSSPSAAPAAIPDIIFTDFSGDLGMSKELDGGLFGCEEERLREGLDPVDLEGLTLLTDPGSLLSDPSAEDVFRLDRL